jgi:general L-amino acid transport system permease protein
MSNSSEAFFRSEMLPPKEPPLSQRGILRWLRENMFSSVLNGAITVVGVAFVIYLIVASLPWFEHSVWSADSLRQCTDTVKQTWGADASGACWAVIRTNWNLYLYGFYPLEDAWRANLAFVLMLVALAPLLFSQLPRKMIWFTMIYPAVGYWLIWGGSFWVMPAILGGFAIGGLAFRLLSSFVGSAIGIAVAAVAAVLWWTLLAGPAIDLAQGLLPVGLVFVESRNLGGFLLSFIIGICGIGFSLPFGILLSLGRRSDMPLIKTSCVVFIEFIRGVPLITLLFTASFLLAYFLPPGTTFDLVLRVVIMVVLFSSAYIAEVIRGGLAAIPRGQYEAADALGLTYWQAQRLIIMPQALKISIPGIVGVFIGLFKDTTLVIIVGLLDPLMGISNAIRANVAWNGIYWEPYIFAALIFFIFCFGMSRYSMYLERKLKTDHR